MEFRTRAGLALVLLGCFLGGMVILDTIGDAILPADTGTLAPGILLDKVFSKAGFLYGPQSWRPGYDPLGIEPGQDVPDNGSWYLMFIDLNATPVSGNPNVVRTSSVLLTYNFTGLSGRAVFDVYGLETPPRSTRTNRQSGTGSNAYIVTGNATAGRTSMPGAAQLTQSPAHQYTIVISNNLLADSDATTATTYPFAFFPPATSGQGAFHLTPSLARLVGGITTTTDQDGSFYITATGTNSEGTLLLMVAVDRPQPDNFSLRIRTQEIRM
jgi:hypothetical protein